MTEYRVGDKIRVTDVVEGTVEAVEDGWMRVAGQGVYRISGAPFNHTRLTRTIEVTERAPDPWQAGDIAHNSLRDVRVRQADGSWCNESGGVVHDSDDFANVHYTPVVRGGKRVAS